MKKALAVLLAVLMVFSVCVVCVSAEDDGGTETGTTYTWSSSPGLGRINAKASDDTMEVVIFQPGDKLFFGEVTAKTTDTKFRTIQVIYYPDAASIKSNSIKNVDWQTNAVPKYNLDTEKWALDEENGQTAADLMAKSPNHFKTFYTSEDFKKGDPAGATILGMGDLAHARDSAGIDRGDLENGNPIDFNLSGSKFVGWALYSYGSWKADKTGLLSVEVYALWDRGAAPEEKPDEPDEPDGPTEYATPIQATLAKWIAKIEEIFGYAKLVNALPAGLAKLLGDGVRKWLYQLFGIEA